MSKLNIKGTQVLNELLSTKKRFVLSVGSSRSSKTYSILQWIVIEAAKRQGEGIYISVVRASFPSLRRTVYREFVQLLQLMGLYDESKHNKTENVIDLFGNKIEFFSLSDSQKVRGAKREILFINECNEVPYETAQQLFLRTTERVFLDMNPSDIYHWSWKLKDKDDVDYIHSTYLKNPFLTEATIKQIESYKDTDMNFYRVYALGLPGFATTTIYTHWKEYNPEKVKVYDEDKVEQPFYDSFCYGLDVGYSHAMGLVKCYFKDDTVWVEEVIYKTSLTSADLITLMKEAGIEEDIDIWCDAASPVFIEDLRRAGFSSKAARKDVKAGIDLIKSKFLYINENSTNLIQELRRYQWRMKGEEIIYEPVKLNDDLVDALRYAVFNYYHETLRYDTNIIDVEFLDF